MEQIKKICHIHSNNIFFSTPAIVMSATIRCFVLNFLDTSLEFVFLNFLKCKNYYQTALRHEQHEDDTP